MMRRFSLLLMPLVVATSISAQTVRYEVSVARAAFHVSAEFPAAGKDTLFVSLPAWSPGNYEIQNYARYVHGFTAHNTAGASLRWDRRGEETMPVGAGGRNQIRVGILYLARTNSIPSTRHHSCSRIVFPAP